MLKMTAALIAGLLACASPGWAQTYPSQPVHLVVGFGAGGPDTVARVLAAQLETQTGQRFIVDNKPGSTGIIGVEYAAKAKPDGYTLLITPESIASLPALHAHLSFDIKKDFIPISEISSSDASFLVVSNDLPVKSLQDFITYAKAQTQEIAYGSSGIGTGSHLRMAVFANNNHVKMLHVPFKSPSEAAAALLGGEIQAMFVTVTQGVPLIQSGKVRALGYDYATRDAILPNVPTLAQAGGAPTDLGSGWIGLLAPAGTPQTVIARLQAEVRQAVAAPAVQQRLKNLGLIPVGSDGAAFGKVMDAGLATMKSAVATAGIQPQ